MTQVAVVTGASRGLGAGCVAAFIEAGYQVAALDLTWSGGHANVLEVVADVTDSAAVEAAFDQVRRTLGPPTVCVHAAGIYPRSTLADASAEAYRRIFDVNVLGTVLVDQAFAQVAGRGSVCINVASVDGLDPFPKSILYSASKAAVVNLTAGIATELAESGIRVFAIAPGYIATETIKQVNDGVLPPEAAEPLDIGRTCVRLAADGGPGLITGQTFVVKTSALELGLSSHTPSTTSTTAIPAETPSRM